jgi:uncharacterized protein (TIGR02453 family)
MAPFTGFPREALTFLEELEAHNDRDWFKANRARYDEHLVAPATALGEALADLGRPKLFRPFNDVRFHGRPPIKEHLGLAIGYEGSGGFYVELSLDGLLLAAGIHNPTRDQLARLREAIGTDRRARRLEAALATAEAAGLRRVEPTLKRAPKGWDPDHPRIELLRCTSMTVSVRHPLRAWLHTRAAGTRIRHELEAAAPLVDWLRREVGPSQAAPVP